MSTPPVEIPSAEAALLQRLLRESELPEDAIAPYFAALEDPDERRTRWQLMVVHGAPKAAAKAARSRWKSLAGAARALERDIEALDSLERPVLLELVARDACDLDAVGAALRLRTAIRTEGRRVNVAQLLIDAGQLTPELFVATVEGLGQRLLWCRDCATHVWLGVPQETGDPLCDVCHAKLRPRPGAPTAAVAQAMGYDDLDVVRPAIERDGVAYGAALHEDASGALHEAVEAPGNLLKVLPDGVTADAEALRAYRRHLGDARRLPDRYLAAPLRLLADDDEGAHLLYDLPPGALLTPPDAPLTEPAPAAVRAVRDITRGLVALHRAGLVSGGVRPAAIWCAEDAPARLILGGEAVQPGLDAPPAPAFRSPALRESGAVPAGPAGQAADVFGACACLAAAHGISPEGVTPERIESLPEPLRDVLQRGLLAGDAEEAEDGECAEESAEAPITSAAALLAALAPLLPEEDAAGRKATGRRRSKSSPVAQRGPALLAVALLGVVLAVAAALHLIHASSRLDDEGRGKEQQEARENPRVEVGVIQRETLGMHLARSEVEQARTYLERLTPSPEQRRQLLEEGLSALPSSTLLQLSGATWPELADALRPLLEGEDFRSGLASEAADALEMGKIDRARRLMTAAAPPPEARRVALRSLVNRMDLDQLLTHRASAWPMLAEAVRARLVHPDTRRAFMTRAGRQVDRRDLDGARQTIRDALGLDAVHQPIWEEVLATLPDARLEGIGRSLVEPADRPVARAALAVLRRRAPAGAERVLESFHERADAAQDRKRYRLAVAEMDAALALAPGHVRSLLVRGVNLRWLGQFDAAITDFDAAIAADPKSPVPLRQRGITYRDAGRYDRALADLEAALERLPKGSDSQTSYRTSRLLVLLLAGKPDAVDAEIAALRPLLEPATRSTDREQAARAARRLDHLTACAALAQHARGDSVAARATLGPLLARRKGQLLRSAGQSRANMKLADMLVSLLPDDPNALLERALSRIDYRRVDEGLKDLERAIGRARELGDDEYAGVLERVRGNVLESRDRLSGKHDVAPQREGGANRELR